METEIWKEISNSNSKYVSNLGNLKSINKKTGKERILKLFLSRGNGKGYLQTRLTINGKESTYPIHKLIMLTFIGPRPTEENGQKYDINHIDGNRLNNRLENLEYVTHRQNVNHTIIKFGIHNMLGKFGKLHHNARKINQYDLDGNFIRSWDCMEDIKRKLKIFNISRVCKGKAKTAGGFIWKYFNK